MRKTQVNETHELVQQEKAYLLSAEDFDKERWRDFIVFAEFAGCLGDADEMRRRYEARTRTSDYSVTVRAMRAASEVMPDLTHGEVNRMIGESVQVALDDMNDDQRGIILREAKHLQDSVSGLGYIGSLILLASISEFV